MLKLNFWLQIMSDLDDFRILYLTKIKNFGNGTFYWPFPKTILFVLCLLWMKGFFGYFSWFVTHIPGHCACYTFTMFTHGALKRAAWIQYDAFWQ